MATSIVSNCENVPIVDIKIRYNSIGDAMERLRDVVAVDDDLHYISPFSSNANDDYDVYPYMDYSYSTIVLGTVKKPVLLQMTSDVNGSFYVPIPVTEIPVVVFLVDYFVQVTGVDRVFLVSFMVISLDTIKQPNLTETTN